MEEIDKYVTVLEHLKESEFRHSDKSESSIDETCLRIWEGLPGLQTCLGGRPKGYTDNGMYEMRNLILSIELSA